MLLACSLNFRSFINSEKLHWQKVTHSPNHKLAHFEASEPQLCWKKYEQVLAGNHFNTKTIGLSQEANVRKVSEQNIVQGYVVFCHKINACMHEDTEWNLFLKASISIDNGNKYNLIRESNNTI